MRVSQDAPMNLHGDTILEKGLEPYHHPLGPGCLGYTQVPSTSIHFHVDWECKATQTSQNRPVSRFVSGSGQRMATSKPCAWFSTAGRRHCVPLGAEWPYVAHQRLSKNTACLCCADRWSAVVSLLLFELFAGPQP